MKQNFLRPLIPLILLFVALIAMILGGRILLSRWSVDNNVLLFGNLLLFIVTLISFSLGRRGIQSGNVQAFIRSVYSSFIIKFFVIAIAAFIYIISLRKDVNKPALIVCMCLYLVYTFFEVSILVKMSNRKKNE
ncbi:MAG: hypothetical protein B6D37_15035 [Sphingobacteriales bacterium UTBCD1]|jgi:signal transduction histidine kinase|nr:MAG: hypothetical protein B6D37_15035 [Sphingobacteriales bacterium UTBCD1]